VRGLRLSGPRRTLASRSPACVSADASKWKVVAPKQVNVRARWRRGCAVWRRTGRGGGTSRGAHSGGLNWVCHGVRPFAGPDQRQGIHLPGHPQRCGVSQRQQAALV